MNAQQRREWAYWLTLAFRLEGEPRRAINGLVLTADRRRATDATPAYPTPDATTSTIRVSDNRDIAYDPSPPDPIFAELNRLGSGGATARELEQVTKMSKHRVSKRLKELLDARLVTKSGPRYYRWGAARKAFQRLRRRCPRRASDPKLKGPLRCFSNWISKLRGPGRDSSRTELRRGVFLRSALGPTRPLDVRFVFAGLSSHLCDRARCACA